MMTGWQGDFGYSNSGFQITAADGTRCGFDRLLSMKNANFKPKTYSCSKVKSLENVLLVSVGRFAYPFIPEIGVLGQIDLRKFS